jgi:hypothetical protein
VACSITSSNYQPGTRTLATASPTPVGSKAMFASARDWARYSTTSTLGSDYGAGFWINDSDAESARAFWSFRPATW